MLRVTLLGHLGKDAEQRATAKGTQIVSLSVAVNQRRTTATGQPDESTEWFRVTVAGRQAEYAAHMQKGQRVLVDGRMQISHFQRRDGTPGIGFDVWADDVQTLSARSTAPTEDGDVMAGAARGVVVDELADPDVLPF